MTQESVPGVSRELVSVTPYAAHLGEAPVRMFVSREDVVAVVEYSDHSMLMLSGGHKITISGRWEFLPASPD